MNLTASLVHLEIRIIKAFRLEVKLNLFEVEQSTESQNWRPLKSVWKSPKRWSLQKSGENASWPFLSELRPNYETELTF